MVNFYQTTRRYNPEDSHLRTHRRENLKSNSDNFEKWVNEKVIPNLASPCVIVMDSAPYHGKQVDKPPTKSSPKKDMLEYLRRHGVSCEEGMKKFTLFSLVEKILPKEKVYHIDTLFAAHGHTVIRLPPYMCDQNPMANWTVGLRVKPYGG
jgi:hypothetical protein